MREVGAVLLGLAAFVGGCGPAVGAPARPSVQSFESLIARAADAAPDGVRHLEEFEALPLLVGAHPEGRCSDRMPSVGFSGTVDQPFGAHSVSRRFGWDRAVAKAPLGAPEVAIEHADAQAAVLAQGGFVPLDAGATTTDAGGDRLRWLVTRSRGQSGGEAALRPARLVHRRIYHSPGTSAFVIARNEYEAATGLATVELTWVEASPESADRDPGLRVPVRETLSLRR